MTRHSYIMTRSQSIMQKLNVDIMVDTRYVIMYSTSPTTDRWQKSKMYPYPPCPVKGMTEELVVCNRLKEKKQGKREWGVERRSHSRQYDERVTIDNRLSSTGLVSSGVACRLNWNKGENVGARGFSVPRLTPRLSFSLFLFLPR
jgi:hypothetical protein